MGTLMPGRAGGRALLCLALALAATLPCPAQLVAPGKDLLRIETRYFDIHFPAGLEPEARRLASFADGLRESLASGLGIDTTRRIPVILSDSFSEVDGSFTNFPSNRILLIAAPTQLDGILGNFDDDMRSVFHHELLHALSIGIRSPFWDAAAFVFGDLLSPAMFIAPPSFVEGISVSGESAAGQGRVNDPLAGSILRQDLLEGRRRGFWQAAGARDTWPFGTAWLYGGYFSAWLRSRYGDEGYNALWEGFGAGRSVEDSLLLHGAFTKAYAGRAAADGGLAGGLEAEWSRFLDGMTPTRPVVMALRLLTGEPGSIAALAAGRGSDGGARLWWADTSAGAVLEREEATGRIRRLFAADGSVNRLSASADGKRLLVSSSHVEGSGSVLIVREFDLEAGRFRGPILRGLREASWAELPFAGDPGANDASGGTAPFVAIATSAWQADVVIVTGGERRIVLHGGPTRSYGSPVCTDGGAVYVIAREGGKRLLVRAILNSDGAAVLSPGVPLDHIRFLAATGDSLVFSFATEDGFYRLAIADLGGEATTIRWQGTELSGGVLQPVLLPGAGGHAEAVRYVASLADGERLAAWPADNPALALGTATADWVPLDTSFGNPREDDGGEVLDDPGSFAVHQAPFLAGAFRVLRLPSVSPELDAAGLTLMGADYAERLTWAIDAQYSWGAGGFNLAGALIFGLSPYSLSIGANDGFIAQGEEYRRMSGASLSFSRSWHSFPSRRTLTAGIEGGIGTIAAAPSSAPYGGPADPPRASAGFELGWSDLRSGLDPPFHSEGIEAGLFLDAELTTVPAVAFSPALQINASASWAPLGLVARLDGAAALGGETLFGPGGRFLGLNRLSVAWVLAPAYAEYAGADLSTPLYAQADLSISLGSAEVQRRILRTMLYVRRASIRAGARGAVLASWSAALLPLASFYGRLVFDLAPLVGTATAFDYRLGAEISFAFGAQAPQPFRLALLVSIPGSP